MKATQRRPHADAPHAEQHYSIAMLRLAHEALKREMPLCAAQYADLGGGWTSTTPWDPARGGIDFVQQGEAPVVTFLDKYRRRHTGIVWRWDFRDGRVSPTVICTDRVGRPSGYGTGMDAAKYGCSVRQLTVLEGELSAPPPPAVPPRKAFLDGLDNFAIHTYIRALAARDAKPLTKGAFALAAGISWETMEPVVSLDPELHAFHSNLD